VANCTDCSNFCWFTEFCDLKTVPVKGKDKSCSNFEESRFSKMAKKKKQELTPRQSDVFKFIKRFQSKHGYPPTRQEISDQFGFKSKNAATDHIRLIASKGWIEVVPGINRGIKIV